VARVCGRSRPNWGIARRPSYARCASRLISRRHVANGCRCSIRGEARSASGCARA
jgi:hypothetical protein